MSTDSPRRIIPNVAKQVPEADLLISDILSIFQTQITHFANKSRKGLTQDKSLPPEDARVLQGYAKMLVELSKETRERAKADDASGMSDEQLLEAMEALRAKIKPLNVAPKDEKK